MQSFRLNGMRKCIGVELHKKNMPGTEAIGFFCFKENQTQNDEEFPVVATIRTARNCRGFGLILVAGMFVMAAPLASAFMAEEVIVADPAFGMPDPELIRSATKSHGRTRWAGYCRAHRPGAATSGWIRHNNSIPMWHQFRQSMMEPALAMGQNGSIQKMKPKLFTLKHSVQPLIPGTSIERDGIRGNGSRSPARFGSTPFGAIGLAGFGSLQPGDPAPKVCYLRSSGPGQLRPLAWRRLDHPTGIPIGISIFTGRWINHESKAVVFVQPVHGTNQVFIYDVSQILTQIPFSRGKKLETAIWRAPEFPNESLFMSQELFHRGQSADRNLSEAIQWTMDED